ncbi:MAG TPA: host attachment protein [Candidatus Saccharimonadales bacterium]|nr:host attachment protein [Candidatus Saccharimonadales bacterium]
MGNTLIAVTDLGSFICYRMEEKGGEQSPPMELVETFHPGESDHRYANTLTARTGRSASGNVNKQSSGNNSDGESHNMEIEKRRRALKEIAGHINKLLEDGQYERFFLAAPEEINSQLMNALSPAARRKMERNLTCDLTRLGKAEIRDHFAAVAERST